LVGDAPDFQNQLFLISGAGRSRHSQQEKGHQSSSEISSGYEQQLPSVELAWENHVEYQRRIQGVLW
jgi:hypothetical protein